jgi:predicted dienelactone hydrolase
MPEVVFQHTLLDGDLGRHMQMLHLAATAGAGVQPEIRAAGRHALRGFAVDFSQRGRFPVVLLAMGVGADDFTGQGAVDEDHLAIGLAGYALGIHVHGQHFQPALGQRRGIRRDFGQVFGNFVVAGFTHGARLSQATPYPRADHGKKLHGRPCHAPSRSAFCKAKSSLNVPPTLV